GVYALSTAVTILCTFLPVFWFIPTYGTRPTLEGFGLVLVLASVAAMWARKRFYAGFAIAVIFAWIFLPSGIRPPEVGTLLTERESAYNYIQVVQSGTVTELILNEGQAIHSVYDSTDNLTHGYWDYLLVANAFRPAQPSQANLRSIAILGLAGVTTARQYRLAYGASVYTKVFVCDSQYYNNTIVYGTTEKTTHYDITHNLGKISAPLARDAAQDSLLPGRLLPSPYNGQVYTDDLAPVEQLIDDIIF